MGKISVTRIKRGGGGLINYYCILNMSKEEFTKGTNGDVVYSVRQATPEAVIKYRSQWWVGQKTIIPIKNGETISIDLEDGINKMFIWTDTASGEIFSDEIEVSDGKSYSVKTKAGLFALKMIVSET